jgi:uncharacterized cupin superfamily protein
MAEPGKHLTAAEITAASGPAAHPWNPNSELHGAQLSRLAGLKRTGVSLARIRPGKESFVFHAHEYEEEWLYILSGRATARMGEETVEVGPGDFLAFPTPSVAHHLVNTGAEDLVYLMGGENLEHEVATFPELGKLMLKRNGRVDVFDLKDAKPLGPLE